MTAEERAAIEALQRLGDDIRRDGAGAPIPDLVQSVRQMREAQTSRKLKAAGIE